MLQSPCVVASWLPHATAAANYRVESNAHALAVTFHPRQNEAYHVDKKSGCGGTYSDDDFVGDMSRGVQKRYTELDVPSWNFPVSLPCSPSTSYSDVTAARTAPIPACPTRPSAENGCSLYPSGDDHHTNVFWLDFTCPPEDGSQPGAARGDRATIFGVPAAVYSPSGKHFQ
ncbi:hypothetical protein LX36DRAFT_660048 [Colletotrichum falcatum]|nr:hypothetical protein LX36DRAFT_660048 [Colletotrichum falcatum]